MVLINFLPDCEKKHKIKRKPVMMNFIKKFKDMRVSVRWNIPVSKTDKITNKSS